MHRKGTTISDLSEVNIYVLFGYHPTKNARLKLDTIRRRKSTICGYVKNTKTYHIRNRTTLYKILTPTT
jgi:hypothetical protein